jgi:hypothetical protein
VRDASVGMKVNNNRTFILTTNKGVQIMHYYFAVTCDFTTVNVTHTFVNGVLNIIQQGFPNQANCICYTDVSYTIDGISQNEVNVIFINGVQRYCYNENYPMDIPFTKYSLAETSCQWKDFQADDCNNAIVIINRKEKLENYIECTNENSYPDIDFSKYTLLLAHGVEGHMVFPNDKSLQQLSAQRYMMKVNLLPNFASVVTYWQVPIIVNKIADDSVIELIVTKNP